MMRIFMQQEDDGRRRRCLSCRLQLPTASFIIEECGFEWEVKRLACDSALRVVLHFRVQPS